MSKLHCWESETQWIEQVYGDDSEVYYNHMASDGPSRSCMMPSGHAGPHVWTDNETITVKFK